MSLNGSFPIGDVHVHELRSVQEAQQAAGEEASATGGRTFPAVMFRQGGRINLSMALSLSNVAQLVDRQSAIPGGDPRQYVNRPLMADHSRTIENYLVENTNEYILPSITLTTATDLSVYTLDSAAAVRAAWVVVVDGTQFLVTDGQHRLAALTGLAESRRPTGALNKKPELGQDGIAVHLVFEKNRERIHQDFADAAQSKQIPPSMLAAYNTREPFNRVLGAVVEQSALFKGRIDMMSKTLSKNSTKLFLLNQVRGFLKELIIGDYAASEDAVSRTAADRLETKELQDEYIQRAVHLIDLLTREMQPWTAVLSMEPGTPASNKIPQMREDYLNLTATGLNLIGRVAKRVYTNVQDPAEQDKYFKRLAAVDWSKRAKAWQGTVIAMNTTKLQTARSSVDGAFKELQAAVQLAEDWK